jgi:hypothetical protein
MGGLPMSYAIRKDGKGWRAVNGPEDILGDEIFSEIFIDPIPDREDLIKRQINFIESEITIRRIREAILDIDNGWLSEKEDQIASLRSKL